MNYKSYSEYLAHPKFLESVRISRSRSDGKCENCGSSDKTEPHHVRYCHWGEFDPPENLLMLCRPCHEDAHRCEKCRMVALKAFEIKKGASCCRECREADLL